MRNEELVRRFKQWQDDLQAWVDSLSDMLQPGEDKPEHDPLLGPADPDFTMQRGPVHYPTPDPDGPPIQMKRGGLSFAAEAPHIVSEPTGDETYIESKERQEQTKVQSFEGSAGMGLVPELSDVGLRTDKHQLVRGMWMGGEFVYFDPTIAAVQAIPAEDVKDFHPDRHAEPILEEDEPPDWRQHAKPGAVGIAGLRHPSDRGRVIEVRGLWAGEDGEDRVMWYWALDGTVSGSALTEDVVGFTPEVIWDDALSEEITEDVYQALVARGYYLSSDDKVTIANAILFRRPQP